MTELDLVGQSIVEQAATLFAQLDALPADSRIDVINEIRTRLHHHSPMRNEPVDCVLWVRQDHVHANDYNPNVVAPAEMDLLKLSITADGLTQPIVAWPVGTTEDDTTYEVVDGFHRTQVVKTVGNVRDRVHGRMPVTIINPDRTGRDDRIASTIRHNRARGEHAVAPMAEIVTELSRQGRSDTWIGEHLGMDPDEVLRLRQVNGMAEAWADRQFSEAWEIA